MWVKVMRNDVIDLGLMEWSIWGDIFSQFD